jgi:hypothetical protein
VHTELDHAPDRHRAHPERDRRVRDRQELGTIGCSIKGGDAMVATKTQHAVLGPAIADARSIAEKIQDTSEPTIPASGTDCARSRTR